MNELKNKQNININNKIAHQKIKEQHDQIIGQRDQSLKAIKEFEKDAQKQDYQNIGNFFFLKLNEK